MASSVNPASHLFYFAISIGKISEAVKCEPAVKEAQDLLMVFNEHLPHVCEM